MDAPVPILVVGNAVLDVILEVDHYPREDEEMRATSRRVDLGGNAANTARVLAGLGHAVALLASVARDADADTVRRLLDAAGVEARHLVAAANGQTPLSTILLHASNGSRTIVHHRDLAELRLSDFCSLPLQDYAWVHFEGRNVPETERMLQHLRTVGYPGRVSVEMEKARPGIDCLAAQADLVLFSRPYAEALGYREAAALLASMHRLAPASVLTCTWGEQGGWALDAGGALRHCPAFAPDRVVDTVGAGDVFNAGMIAGLLSGSATADALAAATQLAGRKVGQRGYAGLARSG